jgi:ubiquinone/menaquinone biosynthesis C-methylase UbiE
VRSWTSKVLGTVIGYSAVAYVVDVLYRPATVAAQASRAAASRGKPLLNVGAGTSSTSVRAAVFGPTMWGDINCDLAGEGLCDLDSKVCPCDAHNLPFADKQFGAAIASHVLEHVDDPQQALAEMHRVADEVFVITPPWWAPHTWLHPGHLWYRRADGTFVRIR